MNSSVLVAAPVIVLMVVLVLGFVGCELPTQGTGPTAKYYLTLITDTPGLVAYWRLGDTGDDAIDQTGAFPGQYAHGALLSSSQVEGASGWPADSPAATGNVQQGLTPGLLDAYPGEGCYEVDGGWVVVNFPELNPPNDPGFSIEAAVRPEWDGDELGVERVVISSLDVESSGVSGFALVKNAENRWAVRIGTGDGSGPTVAASDQTITSHSTYMLCATYDGTNLRLFEDGSQTGSVSGAYVPNTSKPFFIGVAGGPQFQAPFPFKGRIQEVAVYNRPLNWPDEIQARWWSANYGP